MATFFWIFIGVLSLVGLVGLIAAGSGLARGGYGVD